MRARGLIAATAIALLACAFVPSGHAATADCRPTRAIFYAPTDWLRLATTMAQNASPCAQYYVTVPPLAGDKTQPRAKQAALIRALGPNVHPLDEVSYAAWGRWVAANGSDWFTAGVTARQRMVVAGYDTTLGDSWAMNEVSSAVRKNSGAARRNLTEFLRGLYDGGGNPLKGVVFAIGQSQGGDQSAYKATLQAWLQDSTFWTDVTQYVSDWLQEDYGDLRAYAVTGASAAERRDNLVQFLGHPLALANAGADLTPAARAFLVAAYGPLANGAWAWSSSYGWTAVPSDQMEDFVSAQTYAARALDAEAQLPVDRFGFAWAPNNTQGLGLNDFTRQTQAIMTRLAQAIRDSADNVDPSDPGVLACGPVGQLQWCQNAVIPGAAFTTQWAGFSAWTQTGVAFTGAPLALTAGTTAGPIDVELRTGTVPTPAMADTPVALATSSTKGQFATSPSGPWSSTLTLTIPAGTTTGAFYYQDTVAGTATISATLPGQPAATQVETVTAAAPAQLKVTPASIAVLGGARKLLAAAVTDQFGNPSTAPVAWTIAPTALGTLSPSTGGSTTFTASATAAGRGRITASVGDLAGTVLVKVARPPARIGGTLTRRIAGHVVSTVWVVRGKARVKGVRVSLVVRHGSSVVAHVTGRTDAHGRFTWRSRHVLPPGRYAAKAAIR